MRRRAVEGQRVDRGRGRLVAVTAVALVASVLTPGVAQAAPPANDDFDHAVAISGLPFTHEVDMGEATGAPDDPNPCHQLESGSAWYSFTSTEDVTLRIDVHDTYVETAIFTGARGGLHWEPGTCESGRMTRELDARAGVTYYLKLAASPWQGLVRITAEAVPAPANDHFADRAVVDALPALNRVSLAAATVEAGEPAASCDLNPGSPSVWYTYTPVETEVIALDADSWGGHNAVAAAYTGTSLGDLTEVVCTGYRTLFRAEAGRPLHFQFNAAHATADEVVLGLRLAQALRPDLRVSPEAPSIHDDVRFTDYSDDPEGGGTAIDELDFGDGTVVDPTDGYAYHRYAADGDYTARMTVSGQGGRTATTTRTVSVRTHDVGITGFSAPATARVGTTRPLTVTVADTRYDETVTVTLHRGGSAGYQVVGTLTKPVPARQNRTVAFTFDYAFTAADLAEGTVVFKVVAEPVGVRDALSADNTVIAPAVRVLPARS
ncbi:PKD domain-containing protein [Saccharothrix texasensis]|uniref:PKD domain-containing protein n=1 Tax=Saccharothrix texasensis TaxID=103734 RepID=A0A3N1H3K0_9PSEU|nr:PKD domain-containing protein [Saccharothrix texasensis]ROP37087.1 PKD domain-containing protein [Saccharothrix texasensis]